MRILASTFLLSSLLLTGCAINAPHQLSPEEQANLTKQNDLLAQAEQAPSAEVKISSLVLASEYGSSKAYYDLAKIYATDTIVKRDSALSNEYLSRADKMGNTDATIMLAWNTMYGVRTAKNEEQGIDLMKKAAKTDVRAKREMGLMYGNLRHPFLNKESRGLDYLTEAYQDGNDVEAAYYAFILSSRMGKEKKAELALKTAAERGQPKALLTVGRDALSKGQFMIARDSFLKSALNNDSEAMFELGKGIAEGIFPPTQTVEGMSKKAEAYAWLNEASLQKHLQAKEALDKLTSEMTFDDSMKLQVSKAEASIKEQIKPWNPNNL
jgi:TPR repeat protein